MRNLLLIFTFVCCILSISAQIPTNIGVQILKAEDARRCDSVLENLMRSSNAEIRARAALAAGRIGDEKALPVLINLLERDASNDVRAMAAFALGETESIKAADALIAVLNDTKQASVVRGRAVEAAGKIAAANAKDEKTKALGTAIIAVLNFENSKRSAPFIDFVRLALTAALRARPDGAADEIKPFLQYSDSRVVADALNTLARLRAKNANAEAHELLKTHTDAVVRANAARVLGAAEDKDALDLLLTAATTDADSRVRVSAIRSLGSLKDAKAADSLLEHGEKLLADHKKSTFDYPVEQNELLEIATTLGRIDPESNVQHVVDFLKSMIEQDFESSEIRIALARADKDNFLYNGTHLNVSDRAKRILKMKNNRWVTLQSAAMSYGELVNAHESVRNIIISYLGTRFIEPLPSYVDLDTQSLNRVLPDVMRSYAKFKPKDLNEVLSQQLARNDIFIRATAAELISEQPKTKENVEALKKAFDYALVKDKDYNDAQLAILDALYKLDKKESVGTLLVALNAPDYLVRKKAFELLADKDLQKDFPGIATSLENARKNRKDQVLPYSPVFGTKLGQILNSDTDYRRALSRKNGSVKAFITTEKGAFTIEFYPEEAPLTVDNFIKLANSKYFNGVEVHRVVPNFVMQDGDPRGGGNGGPGWSIRCEVNMLLYDRGAVGMALSGKDTGGSQWFVTHSPQPHLDGGYTVFGRVNETDMKVVDNIVRGDKIIGVKIVERNLPQRSPSKVSKK